MKSYLRYYHHKFFLENSRRTHLETDAGTSTHVYRYTRGNNEKEYVRKNYEDFQEDSFNRFSYI